MSDNFIENQGLKQMNNENRIREIIKTGKLYYKNNHHAILGVQFFAMLPILINTLILYLILFNESSNEFWFNPIVLITIYYPLQFLSQAFYGSCFGLAYDILSSGDEFAEFRGFIYYFKRHWLKYIMISLVFLAIPMIAEFSRFFIEIWFFPNAEEMTIQMEIFARNFGDFITIFYDFLGISLFISLFPSVTAQGSLSKAFKQNFNLLSKKWKSIIFVAFLFNFLYNLVFFFIQMTIWTLIGLQTISYGTLIKTFLLIFNIIKVLGYYLIILPLLAIIETQVYNSIYLTNRESIE